MFHVFIHLSSQSQSLSSSSHRLLLPAPQQLVAYFKGRDWDFHIILCIYVFCVWKSQWPPLFPHVQSTTANTLFSVEALDVFSSQAFICRGSRKYINSVVVFFKEGQKCFKGPFKASISVASALTSVCWYKLLVRLDVDVKPLRGWWWECSIFEDVGFVFFCDQLGSYQWQTIDQENQMLSFNKERKAPIRMLYYLNIYVDIFICGTLLHQNNKPAGYN